MEKPVVGTETMVVSPHYLASAAGASMLQRGGNAFDAAVAVSACLAVVYPHMTGMGGDSFWLMYPQAEGRVRAYNGSGRSGQNATIEAFAGERAIPSRGPRSVVTVPGMVDAWAAVLERYGRLSLSDVLAPAIRYATEGFPMSRDQREQTAERFELLAATPITRDIYTPGGRIVPEGGRFAQRRLGASLRGLAEGGRDYFYRGPLAEEIVSFLQRHGGLLTLDDFADHRGDWVEPLKGAYRGYDIYQLPPNSQGFAGLTALHILDRFPLKDMQEGSYAYYHLLIEALKLSFRDRNAYLTDPEFADIPLDRLLSKAHAETLAARIDMSRAAETSSPALGNDTAYAAVVDGEGNGVSFIQSLYFEFGSAVAAGSTGILLQNRGSFFSLDPNHVNALEPRKRTFHTLMPAMACKDGKPCLLYGTQGGEGQPQTQTALLTRMIDYGMDPQRAISTPRWVWGRTWGEETQELKLEGRIPEHVREALRSAGHAVRTISDFDGRVGHAQAIRIDANGFRIGGVDPRADGAAIGW